MISKFGFIAFVLLLFTAGKAFSQSESATPTLTVTCDRFITVFFPGKIKEIINANTDLEIKTSDASKSSIQIKARNAGFQASRIEIVTDNAQRFPFDVNLSNELQGSTVNYKKAADKRSKKPN